MPAPNPFRTNLSGLLLDRRCGGPLNRCSRCHPAVCAIIRRSPFPAQCSSNVSAACRLFQALGKDPSSISAPSYQNGLLSDQRLSILTRKPLDSAGRPSGSGLALWAWLLPPQARGALKDHRSSSNARSVPRERIALVDNPAVGRGSPSDRPAARCGRRRPLDELIELRAALDADVRDVLDVDQEPYPDDAPALLQAQSGLPGVQIAVDGEGLAD